MSLRSFTRKVRREERKREKYWKKIHKKYHKKKRFSLLRWFLNKLEMRKMKREMKLARSVKYARK